MRSIQLASSARLAGRRGGERRLALLVWCIPVYYSMTPHYITRASQIAAASAVWRCSCDARLVTTAVGPKSPPLQQHGSMPGGLARKDWREVTCIYIYT